MMLLGSSGREKAYVRPSPICFVSSYSQSCSLQQDKEGVRNSLHLLAEACEAAAGKACLWRFDSAGMQWPSSGTPPGAMGMPAGMGMLPRAWRQCVSNVITRLAARTDNSTGQTSPATELWLGPEAATSSPRNEETTSHAISDTPPIENRANTGDPGECRDG